MRHDDAGPRLLGDVGGTNARFAWQSARGAEIVALSSYPCAHYASLEEVLRHYLAEHDLEAPQHAAIGIANPVQGDWVQMTNHAWHFSTEALRRTLGLKRLRILNDFAALALSLPTLQPHELHAVGTGTAVANAPLALVGPGTGLGVSALVFDDAGNELVISGEGGHASLAADDDDEAAILAGLRSEFEHVSAERVLSGPGLENLHRVRARVLGQPVEPLAAAIISQRALDASDPACVATANLFLALLGGFAGNVALTFGALGGVYIGGGIVPRMRAMMEGSPFRRRFEAKGRFADYLRGIPVHVINSAGSPALRGAARALDRP